MLLAFFTNRVKLVARKPETTIKSGQREYELASFTLAKDLFLSAACMPKGQI